MSQSESRIVGYIKNLWSPVARHNSYNFFLHFHLIANKKPLLSSGSSCSWYMRKCEISINTAEQSNRQKRVNLEVRNARISGRPTERPYRNLQPMIFFPQFFSLRFFTCCVLVNIERSVRVFYDLTIDFHEVFWYKLQLLFTHVPFKFEIHKFPNRSLIVN